MERGTKWLNTLAASIWFRHSVHSVVLFLIFLHHAVSLKSKTKSLKSVTQHPTSSAPPTKHLRIQRQNSSSSCQIKTSSSLYTLNTDFSQYYTGSCFYTFSADKYCTKCFLGKACKPLKRVPWITLTATDLKHSVHCKTIFFFFAKKIIFGCHMAFSTWIAAATKVSQGRFQPVDMCV